MRWWNDEPEPPFGSTVYDLWAHDFRLANERSRYGHRFSFRFPCDECSPDGNTCRGHDPELGPKLGLVQAWELGHFDHLHCNVCHERITTPQRAVWSHDLCLMCVVCGHYPMEGDRDAVDRVKCRACERRADWEAESGRDAKEQRDYEAAHELLLSGAGSREEREAALEKVNDYHYGLGCS